MTSTSDRRRRAARVLASLAPLLLASACGLERPPDPPPFDCDRIDRAAERFPDECGDPDAGAEHPDASPDPAASPP